MTLAEPAAPDYDARIRRSEYLAGKYPFAAEVLTFYGQLANFQKRSFGKFMRALGNRSAPSLESHPRSDWDVHMLLPDFPALLALLERTGPAPVKQAAGELAGRKPSEWGSLLTDFWAFGGRANDSEKTENLPIEPLRGFILRAFLQPYCELLAAGLPDRTLESTYRICPRCGSPPLLGVLRPEGDGAKRFLMCSFCLREWEFRRIFCAACGEEAEGKLPVYVAEQFAHIRVESCDTCKSYLRTIDLTKDGHAVPLVDDLSAIPLSLWAHEQGYTRRHANLLGT
jgi:FdhE protein